MLYCRVHLFPLYNFPSQVTQNQFRELFRATAPYSYSSVHPYVSLDMVRFYPTCNSRFKILQSGIWLTCNVFQAEKAIQDMEKELIELQDCTKLFEVTVPDYKDIKLCRRDIVVLKQLWDIAALMQVKGLALKKERKKH